MNVNSSANDTPSKSDSPIKAPDTDLLDSLIGAASEVPLSDSYCRIITHAGSAYLSQQQYDSLLRIEDFDMFIDGFRKKVWKRRTDKNKMTSERLTIAEFHILTLYIQSGKVAEPRRFNYSSRTFESARRKTDIATGRYKWRSFRTHRIPPDLEIKEYQFFPPGDLKYCLVIPLSWSATDCQ